MSDEIVTEAADTAAAEAQTAATEESTTEQVADTAAEAEVEAETKPEADQKEDNTDQSAEGLNVAVPEGMDAYKDDFAKFNTDMSAWLKANPKASAKDALAEAANRQARLVADATKEAAANFEAQVVTWEKAAKADKEFGGADFDKNVAQAVKAIEVFGTPELRTLLDESGLGSHPEVIRFAMRAAKGISESDVAGETKASDDSAALRSRYPSSQG